MTDFSKDEVSNFIITDLVLNFNHELIQQKKRALTLYEYFKESSGFSIDVMLNNLVSFYNTIDIDDRELEYMGYLTFLDMKQQSLNNEDFGLNQLEQYAYAAYYSKYDQDGRLTIDVTNDIPYKDFRVQYETFFDKIWTPIFMTFIRDVYADQFGRAADQTKVANYILIKKSRLLFLADSVNDMLNKQINISLILEPSQDHPMGDGMFSLDSEVQISSTKSVNIVLRNIGDLMTPQGNTFGISDILMMFDRFIPSINIPYIQYNGPNLNSKYEVEKLYKTYTGKTPSEKFDFQSILTKNLLLSKEHNTISFLVWIPIDASENSTNANKKSFHVVVFNFEQSVLEITILTAASKAGNDQSTNIIFSKAIEYILEGYNREGNNEGYIVEVIKGEDDQVLIEDVSVTTKVKLYSEVLNNAFLMTNKYNLLSQEYLEWFLSMYNEREELLDNDTHRGISELFLDKSRTFYVSKDITSIYFDSSTAINVNLIDDTHEIVYYNRFKELLLKRLRYKNSKILIKQEMQVQTETFDQSGYTVLVNQDYLTFTITARGNDQLVLIASYLKYYINVYLRELTLFLTHSPPSQNQRRWPFFSPVPVIKSIIVEEQPNKILERMAPHVFKGALFSRVCPIGVKIEKMNTEKGQKLLEGVPNKAIIFPPQDDNRGFESFVFYCDDPAKHPVLRPNREDKKNIWGVLPCCTPRSSIKTTQSTKALNTDKAGEPGRPSNLHAHISRILSYYLEGGEGLTFNRLGMNESSSTFIESVMFSMGIKAYNITDIRAKMVSGINIQEKKTYNFSCISQENPDFDINLLRDEVRNPSIYFDPTRYYRLMEEYLNINIYLFDVGTIKDVSTGGFIIPHHQKFYVKRNKPNSPCIVVTNVQGGEFQNFKYPRWEPIYQVVYDDNGVEIKSNFIFDPVSNNRMYSKFEKTILNLSWYYNLPSYIDESIAPIIMNKAREERIDLHMSINPYLEKMVESFGQRISGQYIDKYGKLRGLLVNYSKDNKGNKHAQLVFHPNVPLTYPQLDINNRVAIPVADVDYVASTLGLKKIAYCKNEESIIGFWYTPFNAPNEYVLYYSFLIYIIPISYLLHAKMTDFEGKLLKCGLADPLHTVTINKSPSNRTIVINKGNYIRTRNLANHIKSIILKFYQLWLSVNASSTMPDRQTYLEEVISNRGQETVVVIDDPSKFDDWQRARLAMINFYKLFTVDTSTVYNLKRNVPLSFPSEISNERDGFVKFIKIMNLHEPYFNGLIKDGHFVMKSEELYNLMFNYVNECRKIFAAKDRIQDVTNFYTFDEESDYTTYPYTTIFFSEQSLQQWYNSLKYNNETVTNLKTGTNVKILEPQVVYWDKNSMYYLLQATSNRDEDTAVAISNYWNKYNINPGSEAEIYIPSSYLTPHTIIEHSDTGISTSYGGIVNEQENIKPDVLILKKAGKEYQSLLTLN